MIEELRILQEIIGDLSGLGAWLVGAYIGYKVLLLAVLTYIANLVIKAISAFLKPGITRGEANTIQADMALKDAKHEAQMIEVNSECERVKHMYKILKEAKDVG